MKVITKEENQAFKNSDICIVEEYDFKDKDLDLGVATIKGRYPDKGYCANKSCKELVYIVSGTGKLVFKDKEIKYKKGDSILIYPNELYYWDTKNTKVALFCNPAFNPDEYIKEI